MRNPTQRRRRLCTLQRQACALQGFDGPLFGAQVNSETQMDESSTSLTCIDQQQCLPLGGYSVWVSMPPLAPASTRPQIIVMTHWDGSGLFRNSITVRVASFALFFLFCFVCFRRHGSLAWQRPRPKHDRGVRRLFCFVFPSLFATVFFDPEWFAKH